MTRAGCTFHILRPLTKEEFGDNLRRMAETFCRNAGEKAAMRQEADANYCEGFAEALFQVADSLHLVKLEEK